MSNETFQKLYKLKGNSEVDTDMYNIEGIASVYDVIDKTGEIIKNGAFDDDLGKVIPIQVMHNGVFSTIGTATLSKTGKKLLVKGELFESSELGKTIALAKSKGVQYNLSIGGRRIDYGWEVQKNGEEIFVTKKGTISEVSITGENEQAHPDAIVTKTINKQEEEKMALTEKEILEIAKALGEQMDKAEDGQKSIEEMKKMQDEVKSLKEELTKAKEKDSKIEELEKVIEKMDATLNEISTPGNFVDGINKSLEEELSNFEKAVRDTTKEGTEYRKALDTTSGAALIPELLANEILKDLKESNSFYANAKLYTGTGKSLEIPVRDSWTNTVEGVAEGSGVVTKGTLSYTRTTIEANYIQSEIELTDEMREDTNFDVQAEIREAATEDFDEHLSQNIVEGVVSAKQKFEGFTKNADLIATAVPTSTALTIDLDDLLDLEMELKKRDRMGARYYASKDAIKDMKKFKDSNGQYLWVQSKEVGTPSTFNGYPVEEVEFMQNKTANAWVAGDYPVLFANFGKLYGIYQKKGMETEMDRKASERIWNHITRMRVGGKVIRPWAGRLLKINTGA